MKPCVIFDLDGTLCDTSADLLAAANAAFRILGRDVVLEHADEEARRTAYDGGGAVDITSWTYPSDCANLRTCFKPLTMTNPAGGVTSYAYDDATGLLTEVREPSVNGKRRTTVTTYGTVQTYSGSVRRPTKVAVCVTGDTCDGSANEHVTQIAYGGANDLPITVTVRAGDGSLSRATGLQHDAFGNVTRVDGPRGGTGDATYLFYDGLQRQVGSIGPSGNGTGTRPASRVSYRADGLPASEAVGTVVGTALSHLDGMTVTQTTEYVYDTQRRPAHTRLKGSNGDTVALLQRNYDGLGRLLCVAQRMNPAAYDDLPLSACDLGTEGI